MRRSFVRRSALALVLALASSACAESQTQDTSIGGRTPFPTASAPGAAQPPTAAQDVTAFVRPLVSSWRPKGTTVVTMAADKLIATSLDGGSSTELVALAPGAEWSLRRDGGALVAAVETASGTTRGAIWEPERVWSAG